MVTTYHQSVDLHLDRHEAYFQYHDEYLQSTATYISAGSACSPPTVSQDCSPPDSSAFVADHCCRVDGSRASRHCWLHKCKRRSVVVFHTVCSVLLVALGSSCSSVLVRAGPGCCQTGRADRPNCIQGGWIWCAILAVAAAWQRLLSVVGTGLLEAVALVVLS